VICEIQFLLEAYRRLESAANRPEAGKDTQDKFESALADIQLLGAKSQIEELMRFLAKWNASNSNASINPLLELLREHLREELSLEKSVPEIKIFRFENRDPKGVSSKNGNKAR
jgi:YesN/AraC family two-component response regulator